MDPPSSQENGLMAKVVTFLVAFIVIEAPILFILRDDWKWW